MASIDTFTAPLLSHVSGAPDGKPHTAPAPVDTPAGDTHAVLGATALRQGKRENVDSTVATATPVAIFDAAEAVGAGIPRKRARVAPVGDDAGEQQQP